VAVVFLLALMINDALRDPRAAGAMIRPYLRHHYPIQGLGDPGHQRAMSKGIDMFGEIIVKVEGMRKRQDDDGDLLESVSVASALLSLQYESAKQAEEFQRILGLIEGQQTTPEGSETRARGVAGLDPSDSALLRDVNVSAIQREATEAEGVITGVVQRLETLMLQVLQMERRTIDIVASAETRRESAEALGRLQRWVEARRRAVHRLTLEWTLDSPPPDTRKALWIETDAVRRIGREDASSQKSDREET
jgi:hypothetical protein